MTTHTRQRLLLRTRNDCDGNFFALHRTVNSNSQHRQPQDNSLRQFHNSFFFLEGKRKARWSSIVEVWVINKRLMKNSATLVTGRLAHRFACLGLYGPSGCVVCRLILVRFVKGKASWSPYLTASLTSFYALRHSDGQLFGNWFMRYKEMPTVAQE